MLGQIRFFILFNVTFLIKIIGYQIITYALTEPLKKIPEAGVVLKNPLSRSRFYKIHWSLFFKSLEPKPELCQIWPAAIP